MKKLAPGMTVQSARNSWRVAYCVRCGWCSELLSYANAKKLACDEDSHICKRNTK